MPSGETKTMHAISRVGQSFGRLHLDSYLGSGKFRKALYACTCACGAKCEKAWPFNGKTPSCGCAMREAQSAAKLKHGHSRRDHNGGSTKAYMTWSKMKHRCSNPNNKNYALYGGRGITVCDEWQAFEGFLADMGEPTGDMTLDRIDTDKGYSKENCRWISQRENCQNKRNNALDADLVRAMRALDVVGKTIPEIAVILQVTENNVRHVIRRDGWSNIT